MSHRFAAMVLFIFIVLAHEHRRQLKAEGQSHSDSQTVDLLQQDISTSWGDSLGKVQFLNLAESDTIGNRAFQFPTLAEFPILITMSVQLFVSVRNAQAGLDFLSGECQLNAPFVFLTLT